MSLDFFMMGDRWLDDEHLPSGIIDEPSQAATRNKGESSLWGHQWTSDSFHAATSSNEQRNIMEEEDNNNNKDGAVLPPPFPPSNKAKHLASSHLSSESSDTNSSVPGLRTNDALLLSLDTTQPEEVSGSRRRVSFRQELNRITPSALSAAVHELRLSMAAHKVLSWGVQDTLSPGGTNDIHSDMMAKQAQMEQVNKLLAVLGHQNASGFRIGNLSQLPTTSSSMSSSPCAELFSGPTAVLKAHSSTNSTHPGNFGGYEDCDDSEHSEEDDENSDDEEKSEDGSRSSFAFNEQPARKKRAACVPSSSAAPEEKPKPYGLRNPKQRRSSRRTRAASITGVKAISSKPEAIVDMCAHIGVYKPPSAAQRRHRLKTEEDSTKVKTEEQDVAAGKYARCVVQRNSRDVIFDLFGELYSLCNDGAVLEKGAVVDRGTNSRNSKTGIMQRAIERMHMLRQHLDHLTKVHAFLQNDQGQAPQVKHTSPFVFSDVMNLHAVDE